MQHVDINGKLAKCDAETNKCPRGGHVPDIVPLLQKEGQGDKVKQVEKLLEDKTELQRKRLAAFLDKHASFDENGNYQVPIAHIEELRKLLVAPDLAKKKKAAATREWKRKVYESHRSVGGGHGRNGGHGIPR